MSSMGDFGTITSSSSLPQPWGTARAKTFCVKARSLSCKFEIPTSLGFLVCKRELIGDGINVRILFFCVRSHRVQCFALTGCYVLRYFIAQKLDNNRWN